MQKVNYESLKTQLDLNEQTDFRRRERRTSEWTENYQLYRDKVTINRLTQRQSINVPRIKESLRLFLLYRRLPRDRTRGLREKQRP